MENDFSAIQSLKELKNLLDSGAITQDEYEALKKKIIFGKPGGHTGMPPVSASQHATPAPVGGDPLVPEFSDEDYVSFDTEPQRRTHDPDALGPEGVGEGGDLAEPGKKDMLLTILITLGVLLLLGLIAYQLMNSQESEKLTSISGPEEEAVADTAAVETMRADPAASRGQIPADTLAAPATVTTPDPAVAPIDGNPVKSTTPPSAPQLKEEEVISRAKDRLESYYDDMRSAPFSAQRHFAPVVERYYTLVNTNPAAINENINTYHFPEFQDSEATIEEGSMKVSPVSNGYEVTYIEKGAAFRKSKNQKQQTKARVRARFDADFKITFFRQEALLENTFVE